MNSARFQPIDYSAWLMRAERFVRSLGHLEDELSISIEPAPPIPPRELGQYAAQLDLKMPRSLVAFYTTASAGVRLHYSWKPWNERLPLLRQIFEHEYSIYGGARFTAPGSLADHCQGCIDISAAWAERSSEPTVVEAWKHALPFCDIGNGDLLAFDGTSNQAEPPIIYLSHEEPVVTRISSSFDRFLSDWEQVCYIGPEGWMLRPWLDDDAGNLRVDRPEATALRQLLISRDN